MNHKHPCPLNTVETAKPAKTSKVKKLCCWVMCSLLTMLAGLLVLRILLSGDGERIQSLQAFSNSSWLLLFRICLYFLIWFYWEKLLSLFIKNLTPELVRHTRRPLLILLTGYELFFASNIIDKFI